MSIELPPTVDFGFHFDAAVHCRHCARLNQNRLVLLNSFGSIYEVDVDGEYTVDTGNIVAFEKTLSFSITKPGSSWIGAFLGGEGFVCRFKGKGKLYCQTHSPRAFGQLIGSRLPPR